jgi:hypothetical protein
VLRQVPDVRSAIKSIAGIVVGVIISTLVLLNPKTWIARLPKISRKRVRKWRRKSRGPPTRFSNRIRHLPVDFTGELPTTRRQRRLRPKMVHESIAVEPPEVRESRIEQIMEKFDAQVSAFNPGLISRSVSTVINQLGYFREEEVEHRRSARLRGLDPEYEGLGFPSRSPRKRRSAEMVPEIQDDPMINLQMPKQSITSRIFAYFGYYDEAEIERRRSLRLQGLEPEYEGLTWGKRTRSSRPTSWSRPWEIFGDYHDDDEIVFDYNDQDVNDGYLQRWLDSFLNIIGYLEFEDIHEQEEEEVIEQHNLKGTIETEIQQD